MKVVTLDAEGERSSQYLDARGQTRQSVDPAHHVIRREYDTQGRQTLVLDEDGVGENCKYDLLGRRTVCENTDGEVTFTIYNAHGQTIQTLDAIGVISLGGASVYPASSESLLASSVLGLSQMDYDSRGRMVQIENRIQSKVTRQYDKNSNLIAIVDGEGGKTTYLYLS